MGGERSVSFGSLKVDEFEYGIGDSPSVSGGVPIALSTKLVRTYKMEVDQFEARKPKRRSKAFLVMDRDKRMKILLSNGYTEKEIAAAVRSSRNLRHARERSLMNKGWDPVHEVAEKALRKVTKPFRPDASKVISSSSSSSINQHAQPMTLQSAAVMNYYAERKKNFLRVPEQPPPY